MKYLFLIVAILAGCTQTPSRQLYFIGKGYTQTRSDITSEEFKLVRKEKHPKISLSGTTLLKDTDTQNQPHLTALHLRGAPHISNKGLQGLDNLTYLLLENMPHINLEGILSLRNLKMVYLWNMPHITDKDVRILQEKGINVFDGRHKRYKNYTAFKPKP